MGTNVTKILCHPQDGGPFCNWHPSHEAYAVYFSDEAHPPKSESLGIEQRGNTDVATLVWKPVVQVVGDPDKDVQIYGEYDDVTGETR